MIKKSIFAVAVCTVLMMGGCTVNMSSGDGTPTPIENQLTEWGEDISSDPIQISESEAKRVLTDLYDLLGKINTGKLYPSDMTYLRSMCSYLAQYKAYGSETAEYMHSVEQLLTAYCNLYARNIDKEQAKAEIDAYVDRYYAMSDDFKENHKPLDNAQLINIMTKVDILADASESSDETNTELK